MLRLRLQVPLVLILLVARDTSGLCALRPYAFRGIVRGQCDGPVVADAKVLVFLDDQDQPLAGGAKRRYPDYVQTDRRGTFRASAWFNTFKSYDATSGHRCDQTPSRVELIVMKPKYLSKRVILDLSNLKSASEGNVQVFELPPIELEPCEGRVKGAA